MKCDDFFMGNFARVIFHRFSAGSAYCALSGCFMIGFLAVVAAFNYCLNPLDYFVGVRESRGPTYSNPRLTKGLLPKRIQPMSIVVGSSRPELAVSAEHPGWRHQPVLNLALSGTTIDEMAAYFEHACLDAPVRMALVCLDYDSCNRSAQVQPTFKADRLRRTGKSPSAVARMTDLHAALLTWRALESSAWLVAGSLESDYLPEGQRNERKHYQKILATGGVLRASERTLAAFPQIPSRESNLNWLPLRRMVRTARELDVKVVWMITPLHETIWREFVKRDGLEAVLQWRRRTLEVIQSEADRCGLGEQVCWDFDNTACMRLSMEEVVEEARDAELPLFYEYSHFSSRVGNLLLDRVLSDAGPNDFGIPLTVRSIDNRLQQLAVAWRSD